MIPTVALPQTDAAGAGGVQVASETGAGGDTGVFESLLSQQAMINADPADLNAVAGGDFSLDDSQDDSTEDGATEESAGDPLWFLSAMLPTPAMRPPASAAVAGGTAAEAPVKTDGHSFSAIPVSAQSGGVGSSMEILAQAFAVGADAAGAGDQPAANVADTTTWSQAGGLTELFAQGSRQGAPVRTEFTVRTHMSDSRWTDELGSRLATMIRTGDSSASLQLTPADLGPLEVTVAVRDNQASVHFGAANAETRALLEASMPRLREMLAAQGFQLMDSSVSHGFARPSRHEAAGTPRVNDPVDAPVAAGRSIQISGLLDLYA